MSVQSKPSLSSVLECTLCYLRYRSDLAEMSLSSNPLRRAGEVFSSSCLLLHFLGMTECVTWEKNEWGEGCFSSSRSFCPQSVSPGGV